jgi:peptidoglycan-N-acetylmuramic acid deacetylase
MRRKTITLLLVLFTLGVIGTSCASSNQEAEQTGMDNHSMENITSPVDTSSPSNNPTSSPIPTASPIATQTTSSVAEATYSPAATLKPQKNPSAIIRPLPAKTGDLATLSWYYMKQGKGKVPNFPKETKSFTPEQKTVWVGTGKKVYLTFDNGGPMGDTKKLLQALKDNGVKATFFIAGYNLKAHPDFLKELIADGHLVANHTMSHKDMTKLTDDQVKKELSDFESLYKGITGKDQPKFFRFPYGIYNRHLLSLVADMGYKSVFWSTAMKDWVPRKNGANDAYNDIMNNLHDGNVILMHQGSDDNIAALDKIIKGIKEAGYGFGLVDEL